MEHSDRENAKRAIQEVHKKYNAAAPIEQQRQAPPVAAPITAGKEKPADTDVMNPLGRAVGASGGDDNEDDVDRKESFRNHNDILERCITNHVSRSHEHPHRARG